MSIHIKPENRGKFTALKKRTGKSASWFKAHGTPAQKKMATFALNAKHWKHADGGDLFDNDVNLFAYGAPIRDYGLEWNNKIDRLLAYNKMISQIGQNVAGAVGKMNGNSDSEGSALLNSGKEINNTDQSPVDMPQGFGVSDPGMSASFAADGGYIVLPKQRYFLVDKKACGGNLKKCGGKLHCGGGKLFDYGGDFTNGITVYENGGTHEENPFEGVPVGVDDNGTPNLVEEGEVRYKDYIFSNRLALDEDMAKKYNIPKKYADATFAYIAEKMGEYSKEREFDPIARRGLEEDMTRLREAQEETRAIKMQQERLEQAQQIADELGTSPEEVLAAMQMQEEDAAKQEAMAQQQAMQQQQMVMPQQEMPQEENAMIEGLPYADGGTLFEDVDFVLPKANKYDDGGDWRNKLSLYDYTDRDLTGWRYGDGISWITPWGEPGYVATTPSFDDRHYKFARSAEKEEVLESFKAFTQAILDDPALREWYFKQYDAATPDKSVKTKFYDKNGNLRKDWKEHFLELRNDNKIGPMHNMAGRVGNRYFYTDANGNRVYVANPGRGYDIRNRGFVEDPVHRWNGWNDYEIMGTGLPQLSASKGTAEAYSRTGISDVPTTSSNAPQLQAQPENDDALNGGVLNEITVKPKDNNTKNTDTPAGKNTVTPNYSLLDFVPLWQYLTAGKPDYYQADALVDYVNRMPKPTYRPIGDFVQYHPFDRQYAANKLRAQTAAQMRNNINLSAGNRAYANAANLAAGMQSMLADSVMQRQADEANLAQRLQVAQFNRGTNQFNAEAFNRLELQRPYQYQLGLQARANRAALHNQIDNAYSMAKSTNLNTWLNNMYNRRREAYDRAQTKWLAESGVFGPINENYPYPEENTWIDSIANAYRRIRGKRNTNG